MPTTKQTQRRGKLIAEIQRLFKLDSRTAHHFHRIGDIVRELHPISGASEKRSYGKGELESLAEEIGGINVNLLYQARTFAVRYRVPELDRLKDVPWTHLTILGSVSNRSQRRKLESFCLRKNASVKELQIRKREVSGKQSQGGRKPASAVKLGPRQTLLRIQQYSQRWLDHGQQLLDGLPSVLPAAAHADAHLDTLQTLQRQIASRMKKLVKVTELLAQGAPDR